jgi:hypothetical protein
MVSPVALGAEVSVPDPCEGKVCDDSNPCTTDYCDAGNCMYRNKLDNTSCGTGMICKSGGCIAEEAPYVPPAQPAQDYTMYIIIAIIIILIIAGAYFMFGKKNKSGWK